MMAAMMIMIEMLMIIMTKITKQIHKYYGLGVKTYQYKKHVEKLTKLPCFMTSLKYIQHNS